MGAAVHLHGHHHDGSGISPVLDIGGDVGALVVRLPDVPASGELEARPAGEPERRFHTGVHLRAVDGCTVPVAVYPAVTQGRYEILDDELEPIATVEIRGGEVAELVLEPTRRAWSSVSH